MGGKLKSFLINLILVVFLMCLVMGFFILCNNYEITHNKLEVARNDRKASEYRMLTEQYRSENARLNYEMSEAKLQAFLKIYGENK